MRFDRFSSRSLKLANHTVMAPMTRSRATPAHTPNELMATCYGQRAGAGLIITEGTSPSLDTLEVDVRLQSRWRGRAAGQFAFVRFDAGEGAHPFTITSPWVGDGRLVFLIKGLGDYTKRLPTLLQPGPVLRVEGPYGTFTFKGTQPRQIWVSGGIGITPFFARLRAAVPDWRLADVWFCGPAGFGQALRRDLLALGLPAGDFHQEPFELR